MNGDDGHRREYAALFKRLVEQVGEPVEVRRLRFADLLRKDCVFLPMLEEQTVSFLGVAALRHLLGRPSASLLFRPREVVSSRRMSHRIKKQILRVVRGMHWVRILTILPFEVDARFEQIATGWIYDPQLWDLDDENRSQNGIFAENIRKAAGGRRIIVSLGAQNFDKGFDFLAEVWTSSSHLRGEYLLVAAGRVSEASRQSKVKLEGAGALVFDRYMDDEELQQLYALADFVWSAYSPTYDQASGVFGRAVQWGVPALVRAESYLERLARLLRHPTVAIPWDIGAVAERLREPPPRRDPHQAAAEVGRVRIESLERLGTALGLPHLSKSATR